MTRNATADHFGFLIGVGLERQAEIKNRRLWENQWEAHGDYTHKKFLSKSDQELIDLFWGDACDDLEDIHFELNRRGRGEDCAV